MKRVFIALAVGLLAIGAFTWWRYTSLFPKMSQETVLLTAEKRSALGRLKAEHKFQPHEYPPAGYTGIATPEDGRLATSAVNNVIDAVLSEPDGPITSKTVSDLIGRELKRVNLLDTEDRDRTGDYMIEIWYLLGFKGATGRFAYGAAFPIAEGYGEPIPPGWKSPTEPRPIGNP